jgi:hypothetical protein
LNPRTDLQTGSFYSTPFLGNSLLIRRVVL